MHLYISSLCFTLPTGEWRTKAISAHALSRTGSVNCANIRHIDTNEQNDTSPSFNYTIDTNVNSLDKLKRRLHRQNYMFDVTLNTF